MNWQLSIPKTQTLLRPPHLLNNVQRATSVPEHVRLNCVSLAHTRTKSSKQFVRIVVSNGSVVDQAISLPV